MRQVARVRAGPSASGPPRTSWDTAAARRESRSRRQAVPVGRAAFTSCARPSLRASSASTRSSASKVSARSSGVLARRVLVGCFWRDAACAACGPSPAAAFRRRRPAPAARGVAPRPGGLIACCRASISSRSLSRSVVTSACLAATLSATASLIRWASSFHAWQRTGAHLQCQTCRPTRCRRPSTCP